MAAKPKKPHLSASELSARYGWAMATLNSSPDLKKLFKTAVSKQYTPERFIAELRSTNWFKKNSESQRKLIVLRTTDPAQYVSQVKQVMASMADQYAQTTGTVLGFTPPRYDAKSKQMVGGTGALYDMAVQSLSMGYNEDQIKDQLFSTVNWTQKIAQDQLGGTSSGMLQQIRQQAAALGVQPTDSWYADQVGKVTMGNDSVEGVTQSLKNLSKQRYGAFADRIEAGESVSDIAEGYRQSMGRILEINPGTVDVFDPKIQGALTARNKDGAFAPASINDFEDELRKDNRWQYTQNAKETLMSTGQNVLKSFGLAG